MFELNNDMKKLLLSVGLFVAVSHPMVSSTLQKGVDAALPAGNDVSNGNCSTALGAMVLAVLFGLVTYLIAKNQDKKTSEKQHRKNAVQAGLLFFLVSNRATYELSQRLIGGAVQTYTGQCPTLAGTAVHAVVMVGLKKGLDRLVN